MFHFSMYDFLWKDDMYGNYYEFIQNEPGIFSLAYVLGFGLCISALCGWYVF